MSERRQIVNIINFIRDIEPRCPMDLMKPVQEQIRLMKEHHLRGTFLLQYDALMDPKFSELMKSLDPEQFEIGVWHEIVQPMTEKAGIEWHGRWAWDWHVHCGFPQGYTRAQREKLVDVLFEDFRAVMGYYPRVFGSWIFDSHTLRYLSDRYGVDAVCNCKEQYGTDGYTLWGGYYGQGYYPSRTNAFMPAQTDAEQLPAPIFRMLGSDPVYQYDFGLDPEGGASRIQGVVTLEPVYCGHTGGGGVPEWVDWYFRENFNGECLSFGYAQAGQENSFGWDGMRDGLTDQFAKLDRLLQEGRLTVEPLGETGRWFKQTYARTPASTITAHGAFDDPLRSSVWYSSRFYRANLYVDHGALRIRDLHLFDEKCPDPFEDTVCTSDAAVYETLPLADGNRFSGRGVLGGLHVLGARAGEGFSFRDLGNGEAEVGCGEIMFHLSENALTARGPEGFRLENRIAPGSEGTPQVLHQDSRELRLRALGRTCAVHLTRGRFLSPTLLESEGGEIRAQFEILP